MAGRRWSGFVPSAGRRRWPGDNPRAGRAAAAAAVTSAAGIGACLCLCRPGSGRTGYCLAKWSRLMAPGHLAA